MKHRSLEPEIKESLSGAFFVKLGNNTLGGFHKKEHAELFLKAYTGELEKEVASRAWQEGVDNLSLLISGRDIVLTGDLKNPYKETLPHVYDVDAPDLIP